MEGYKARQKMKYTIQEALENLVAQFNNPIGQRRYPELYESAKIIQRFLENPEIHIVGVYSGANMYISDLICEIPFLTMEEAKACASYEELRYPGHHCRVRTIYRYEKI